MSSAVRVLQIEDNDGDVALVRASLREAGEQGFVLEHAPRFEAGLERLKRGGVDVALLDLGLPDSRGIETFTRAKAAAPDVPIIVLSGLDDQDLALRAVREGAQEYLVKGEFDGALLARAIRYAIGRAGAERALHESERRFREDLERQVKERTAELERSHVRLRIADRLSAIGTLAAGLGHDMNNVLLPVRCRLDALDAMELPQAARQQVAAVRASAEYLRQLADGLRLLALDPDDAEASIANTSIENWWSEVGPLLTKAVRKPVRLEVVIAPGLPHVAVPRHRLTQAVLNLVVNAAEAVQERAASGAPALVRVSARPGASGTVMVSVEDNGRGMTEEVRRRAVEPFFTTKTRGLGTGLGLALVRGVVVAAGGALHIESEPGEGTTITLELPSSQLDGGGAATAVPSAAGRGRAAAITLRDPRAAAALELVLREAGWRTERLGAGEEAPQGVHAVWVTGAASTPAERVQRYIAAGGRVIWVGDGTPPSDAAAWIAEPFDLDASREAVGRVSSKLEEAP